MIPLRVLELGNYVVYIGFDQLSAQNAAKPAPASKKSKPKPNPNAPTG